MIRPVMTFAQIGRELGISKARAQQLCESGLAKLRRRHRYDLRDFLTWSQTLDRQPD